MIKRLMLLAMIAVVVAVLPPMAEAQNDWYVSATNYARYYHFEESRDDSASSRLQFDVNMGGFFIGGWYELKQVTNSNIGNYTTNKLTQRFLGWEDDGINITLGNFYEVYDRGLVLNSFLDDDVGADLVLDGFKLNINRDYFEIDALSATPGIGDPSFGAKPMLRGGRVKFKPFTKFHFGGAHVSYNDDNRSNNNQVNATVNLGFVDAYIEHVRRDFKQFDPMNPLVPKSQDGRGTYATLTSYYHNLTGFFEYKNYKYLLYPDINQLNLPPAVNRQDRLLYSEAFNSFLPVTGEAGYRANLVYSWNYYWSVEADYARSDDKDSSFTYVMQNGAGDTVSVDGYLHNYYFVLRGNFLGDNTFLIGYDQLEFTMRDEIKPELEIEFLFDDIHSVVLDAYQIKYEPLDSADYTNQYLDITFARSPDIKISIGGSKSDNQFAPNEKQRMAYMQVSYTYKNHELTVFHGSERGGLVCAGGLCTYHPPFEGTRVALLSRF